MIIHDVIQGSPEWAALRCGKITASCMDMVLAKGQGKTRKSYMMRLLAEGLSGIPQETYKNGAMEWGTQTEPQAREYYEHINYVNVRQVGFVEYDECIGCSPDGLIDNDLPEKQGILEIKCPNTSTHLEYILENKMPSDYIIQVQSQLWITERQWCDFISFDPRIPKRPYWCIRVYRDEKKIALIKEGVSVFIREMLDTQCKIIKEPSRLTASKYIPKMSFRQETKGGTHEQVRKY